MARPTPVSAGVGVRIAGYRFPDDFFNPGPPQMQNSRVAGDLDVSLRMTTVANPNIVIKTSIFPNTAHTTGLAPAVRKGHEVAAAAAIALCDAADGTDGDSGSNVALTCVSDPANPLVGGGPCGFDVLSGAAFQSAKCTVNSSPTDGFWITLTASGNDNFFVQKLPAPSTADFRLKDGLEVKRVTDNGTSSGDLLSSFNFRLVPNGIAGTVTFNTLGAPGGSGTNPFTITTSSSPVTPGSAADFALHQQICDKYAAIGIPTILSVPPCDDFIEAADNLGFSIKAFHPPGVTDFQITPVTGQTVSLQVTGSNNTAGSSVPALSEWGMIALVALLVLAGIWMLRRRQRLQSA